MRMILVLAGVASAMAAGATCSGYISPSAAATSSAAVETCHGKTATIVGTTGDDALTGTPGADVVQGLSGDDTIEGLAGDDLLCGGEGSDTIVGGRGSDYLSGGQDGRRIESVEGLEWLVGDTLDPGPGRDFVAVGHQRGWHTTFGQAGGNDFTGDVLSYTSSHRGVHVDLTARTVAGEGLDTLSRDTAAHSLWVLGSPAADTIDGSSSRDWIDAAAGDDTVAGRAGDDMLLEETADTGDDVYRGGSGADEIVTLDGHDVLRGGGDDDSLSDQQYGPENGAMVSGGRGDDHLLIPDVGPAYRYAGGPGLDHAREFGLSPQEAPTNVNVPDGHLSHGANVSQISTIESWHVSTTGPIFFTGSPTADYLESGGASVHADFGAGRDVASISYLSQPSEITMGPGDDSVSVSSTEDLTVRLGSGQDRAHDWGSSYGDDTVDTFYGGSGSDTLEVSYQQHVVCHSIEIGCGP